MVAVLIFGVKKKNAEIFLEIKTLTNFTNLNREKIMQENIKNIHQAGLKNGLICPAFDPLPELEGPFLTFLKSASSKFKNIKPCIQHSRILLLDGIIGDIQFIIHNIFCGASMCKEEFGQFELKKIKHGLLDSTGSNVSGILYWNEDLKSFCGIENYKALVPFPQSTFQTFFNCKTL